MEISYSEPENSQIVNKIVILNGPLASFKDKIDFTDDNANLNWKTSYQIAPQVTLSKSWGEKIRDAIQAITAVLAHFFTTKKSPIVESSPSKNDTQITKTMPPPPVVEEYKSLLHNDSESQKKIKNAVSLPLLTIEEVAISHENPEPVFKVLVNIEVQPDDSVREFCQDAAEVAISRYKKNLMIKYLSIYLLYPLRIKKHKK